MLLSPDRLELLRSSAFESEHTWYHENSYLQHEAAALALGQQIRQCQTSISPDDSTEEQICILEVQIATHRERQRALRLHLKSGNDSPDIDPYDSVFVPAPNQWGANGDLDEESDTLSAVHATLTSDAPVSPISLIASHNSWVELSTSRNPYHSLLDPCLAATTYQLSCTRQYKLAGGCRKYVYTAREYSNQFALYILEATHQGYAQINAAQFCRVAEYPKTCISVLLSGLEKRRMSSASTKYAAYKSRCIHLRGPFAQAVKEYPDRQQKIPWSPRRFTYGGRRFVWKQGDANDDAMPETLYEYSKDWAKVKSRTGKRSDDADPIKLVWGEKIQQGATNSYAIHFIGGMDQVFREILLASQMARQACLFTAVG